MTITTIVLIIAPRESNVQMDCIISIFDDIVTPKVEANKHIPLISMDLIEVLCAIAIASQFTKAFSHTESLPPPVQTRFSPCSESPANAASSQASESAK